MGVAVPVEVVVRLADELNRGLFLEGSTFQAARARVESEFADAAVRPATHAGGAYHGERKQARGLHRRAVPGQGAGLGRFRAAARWWRSSLPTSIRGGAPWATGTRTARWRRVCRTERRHVRPAPAPRTRRCASRSRSAARPSTRRSGPRQADLEAIDRARRAREAFDPYADQFNHKREHSLEFQAVFLRHLLGQRPLRIVPILAGLGVQQASGGTRRATRASSASSTAVRELVEARPGRVVVVAGADLAHVGPRFGDDAPPRAASAADLETADAARSSARRASTRRGFWTHVARDLDARRVCGLAPIWSLLRALPRGGARAGAPLRADRRWRGWLDREPRRRGLLRLSRHSSPPSGPRRRPRRWSHPGRSSGRSTCPGSPCSRRPLHPGKQ